MILIDKNRKNKRKENIFINDKINDIDYTKNIIIY